MSKQPPPPRNARTATPASEGATPAVRATRRGMATPPVRASRSRRAREVEAARARRRSLLLFGGIPLLIVIVLVAVLLITNQTSSSGLVNASKLNPGTQPLKVGTKAPDFTLKTLDGEQYRLSSLRGKPVLLEFFAVWCPHCQRESTILNQVDKNFGPKGLQTLAILASPYGKNYDTSGGNDLRIVAKSDITWFEQTFGVTHPTLVDPNFSVTNTYNASSYPTIYVIDTHGIIRYANSGEQPYANLAAAINTASAK